MRAFHRGFRSFRRNYARNLVVVVLLFVCLTFSMSMLAVKLAAPFTTSPGLAPAPWRLAFQPTTQNGLDQASTVDLLQVRSLAAERFVRRLGVLTDDEMEQIAAAIAAVVEYV